MINILVFLIIFIFAGCGKSVDINNDLNITLSSPSSNLIELFKKLQEYELIFDDHLSYKLNSKKNNDTIEKKINDINYVKSLTTRYDEWNIIWNELMNSNGKVLNNYELKILQKSINIIFDQNKKLNSLASVLPQSLFDYPRDSIYFFEYENVLDIIEL